MAAAAVEERQQFAQVAAVFKPYVLAGRLKTFDGDAELVPGVRSLPSADYKPGHKAYTAESGREKILFCGDALPVIAAQSRNSKVAIRLDITPTAAVARQTALLRDAAAHDEWVTGENLPFPGIGHVRPDGHGFRFVPIILDRP
jgi:glyoxylase-like metal-dependent hydrolase (beta-lactamase superfamily II)